MVFNDCIKVKALTNFNSQSFTASLSTLSTGIVLAWTSQISEKLFAGDLGFPISVDELTWIGSLMPLGAALVSLFTGSLADIIGRKTAMLLAIIPITIGWALTIWATSIWMVYLGRVLCGAVAGMYCVLAPMYSTEISEKRIRGALGSFTQLNIAVGILAATVLGSYLDLKAYTIVCGTIPLVFGAIFVFMPESPFYLLEKGKETEARKCLTFLRGSRYNIEADIDEIKLLLKERSAFNLSSVKATLSTKAAKRACLIALFLMLFRVFCGVDAITAYTTYIMDFAHLKGDRHIATIGIFSLQCLTGILQTILVEYVGRKFLLLVSIITTTITTFIIGITIYLRNHDLIDPDKLDSIGYVPLVALVVFYVGYALGLGPIPWMILSEIFPQDLKSVGSSVACFVSWMSTFVVVKLFLVIQNTWGGEISFFIVAGISTVGILLLYLTVHETRGKSLAQIQEELSK